MTALLVPPVAQSQAGVFTRRQARAAGCSAKREARLVARGDWLPVVGTAYVRAGTPVGPLARAWAGQLLTQGVVSHRSAALLWGLPVMDDGRVHVTVPTDQRVRIEGLVPYRRAPVDDGDLWVIDGVPVTARVRTLLDCLGTFPERQAQRLLDRALLRRWIEPELFAARVRMATGLRGTPQLLRLLREAASGSRSEAERRLRGILRRARIRGWQAGVRLAELGLEVDVLFAAAWLVLELDGKAYHVDDEAFQGDRTRQNRLVAAGYTVLRFTWADVTQRPGYVVAMVRTALRQAAAA